MTLSEREWHIEAISPDAERAVRCLSSLDFIRSFYLAGGTALALYFGHRLSADLDLFATSFQEEEILGRLQLKQSLAVLSKGRETLHTLIENSRVSFLGYPYPLLFPLEHYQGLQVADPRDIACMKISAIAGRGSKRDFVDLYVVSIEHGLPALMTLFQTKFARVNYNLVHLLKSLTYFEDAEKEPPPNLLIDLDWTHIKEFFTREVLALLPAHGSQ